MLGTNIVFCCTLCTQGVPCVPKTATFCFFWITLSINNFGTLNPEKIWHKHLTDLSTSPVRCSHFTLGKSKKVIFSTLLFIYFRLFTLPRLIFYRVIRQIKGRRFLGGTVYTVLLCAHQPSLWSATCTYVRCQCVTARIHPPHASVAAIDRYLLPTGPTSANQQQRVYCRGTARWADTLFCFIQTLLHILRRQRQ